MESATAHGAGNLPKTVSMIEDGVESRLFFCGAQVYVSVDGKPVLDMAAGLARPLREATTDTIFPVWCTTKPVAALAVHHLRDKGILDIDRPFGSYVSNLTGSPIGSVTARAALAHRAGLPASRPELGALANLDAVIERLRELKLHDPPGLRYTPSWGLLAISVVLHELGLRLEDVIRNDILRPLGIADIWLPIRAEQLEHERTRLGTNWLQTRDVLRPFPAEGLEADSYPDYGRGGYASAKALGRFYEALLQEEVVRLGLITEQTLDEMLKPAGPLEHDPSMQRECNYGLGVMVDLRNHGFGEACSDESVGHSGGTGHMLAFADLEDDLVIAAVFPTLEIGGDLVHVASRRPHFVQTIRRELGLLR